jgi:hypothetical protein
MNWPPAGSPVYIHIGQHAELTVSSDPWLVKFPGGSLGSNELLNEKSSLYPCPRRVVDKAHTAMVDVTNLQRASDFQKNAAPEERRTSPPLQAQGDSKTSKSNNTAATRSRRRRLRTTTPLNLARGLSELEEHDAQCVLYVRGIFALGFESEEILRQHYQKYGEVEKIFFSNVHKLPEGAKSSQIRVRPSNIALILMGSCEQAAKALAAGSLQEVAGVQISVRRFIPKEQTFNDSECTLTAASSEQALSDKMSTNPGDSDDNGISIQSTENDDSRTDDTASTASGDA